MAKNITNAVKTATKEEIVRPIYFVEIYFTTTLYLCSSDKNIIWNGNTYIGVGNLGKISLIEESSELRANGISLEMSGILQEHISLVLNEKYQGKTTKIYLGFLNDNYTVIIDPTLLFEGLVSEMSIKMGSTCTVFLSAENKLIRWETPIIRRYTNADQQAVYPGDLGLEFVNEINDKEIIWGRG